MNPSDHRQNALLIIGSNHGIGPQMTAYFRSRNYKVTEVEDPSVQTGLQDSLITLKSLWEQNGPFHHIFFNCPDINENDLLSQGDVEKLTTYIERDVKAFIKRIHYLAQQGVLAGGCKIWVMLWEDSFSYYIPLPIAPISSHFRVGTLRALVKEVSHFSVHINALILQPVQEILREKPPRHEMMRLNTYTQKYKLTSLNDILQCLSSLMVQEKLPINGAVLHFGNGVYDGNY